MAMSICGLPSAAGFALLNFTVQRASVSFWRALDGLSGQIAAAFSPALMRALPPCGRCLKALGLGVALAGRCQQGRVHDLARHRQAACPRDRRIEPGEQRLQRTGGDQCLASLQATPAGR